MNEYHRNVQQLYRTALSPGSGGTWTAKPRFCCERLEFLVPTFNTEHYSYFPLLFIQNIVIY